MEVSLSRYGYGTLCALGSGGIVWLVHFFVVVVVDWRVRDVCYIGERVLGR